MSQVERAKSEVGWFVSGIWSSFSLTVSKLFSRFFDRQTRAYSFYSPRFKGMPILTVRKDGGLRCTACMLCVTACPSDCIRVEPMVQRDAEASRFPVRFDLDILKCVFCGMCEEVCPVDAIRMGPEWQTPAINGSRLVYTKEDLSERPGLAGGVTTVVFDKERNKVEL